MRTRTLITRKGSKGKTRCHKKVVLSIRPSVVNNRFHNFSSSFHGRSHLSYSRNEANGKLLAINKSLRKNNKSLALAYQEMKIQLRMKNDEILTLLDERMECQGKLLDVNYAAKSKCDKLKEGLERSCRMFQAQVQLMQEMMNACIDCDSLDLQDVTADNSVDASPRLNSGDQSNGIENICDADPDYNSSEFKAAMEDEDTIPASMMSEDAVIENEHLLERQTNRTKFDMTVIDEECSVSIDEDVPDDLSTFGGIPSIPDSVCSPIMQTQSFFTKRGIFKLSRPSVISPFNSPLIQTPDKNLNTEPPAEKVKSVDAEIPIKNEGFSCENQNPIDFKIFQSKAKRSLNAIIDQEPAEQSELHTSIYNLSNLEESTLMVEESAKAIVPKAKRRNNQKRKKAGEKKKRKKTLKKASTKTQQEAEDLRNLPENETVHSGPPPPAIPIGNLKAFIKTEVMSPVADDTCHNNEAKLTPSRELPPQASCSRIDKLLESEMLDNFKENTKVSSPVDKKPNIQGYRDSRDLNCSAMTMSGRPSRSTKPGILKEVSLRKKLRRCE